MLYRVVIQPEVARRWRFGLAPLSFNEFSTNFYSDRAANFTILGSSPAKSEAVVLGYATLYGHDASNGTVHFAIVTGTHRRPGEGAIASILAMSCAYRMWPIRKIYAEVAESNLEQFHHGYRKLFDIEGSLRAHQFMDGVFCNVLILAAHRERALPFIETFLAR